MEDNVFHNPVEWAFIFTISGEYKNDTANTTKVNHSNVLFTPYFSISNSLINNNDKNEIIHQIDYVNHEIDKKLDQPQNHWGTSTDGATVTSNEIVSAVRYVNPKCFVDTRNLTVNLVMILHKIHYKEPR